MNLSTYTRKELLLSAMKSEVDSEKIYTTIANHVQNGLMKDKFKFLAHEEQKHKQFIESIYKSEYPSKPIDLPTTTPVPLPEITIPEDENISLSTLLDQAISAEKAAADFYLSLSEQFDKKDIQQMLHYFSDMEKGHMRLLEQEKQSIEWFEQADVYWPMIHAGP